MSNSELLNLSEEVKARTLGMVTFDSEPYEIPERLGVEVETVYILSCFESNIYIKTLEDDPSLFAVTDTYGEPLQQDKEYILIKPKY